MGYKIEFFRNQYKRQKKLEKIVNSRILQRPKTKKWQVMASFIILPFLLILDIFICLSLNLLIFYRILILISSIILIFELYIRFCLFLTVKSYQHYAKEETRRRCKCIPSCSEYAIISLKRVFPLLLALLKIRKRLYVTCDGEDYKIDFPTKKTGEKFENDLQ